MELPNIKADAVQEATEMYAKTKNARFIDSILDKACFQVMSDAAEKLGNEYVSKYVRKLADVTNLKTLLRIWQLKRSDEELEESIVPGGELPAELLIKALKNDNVIQMLKDTSYGTLCETYMDQGFTVFEKACDDYLMECIKDAKYKTLTPEPVAAYILAKETEAKCVRIIMTCKLHDIDAETIKERVREAYVYSWYHWRQGHSYGLPCSGDRYFPCLHSRGDQKDHPQTGGKRIRDHLYHGRSQPEGKGKHCQIQRYGIARHHRHPRYRWKYGSGHE